MLDLEMSVKKQVEEALSISFNPKQSFNFEEIFIDEIFSDTVHFDGNVTLESDQIEFFDKSFSREDFITNLDRLEQILFEDELKVKEIDAHLNRLIRKNRQTVSPIIHSNEKIQDSTIHNLGPYYTNGRFEIKTLRVLPPDGENPKYRQKRYVDPIDEQILNELKVDEIKVKNVNGIPVEDWLFTDENGLLNIPNSDIIFHESIQAKNIIMPNGGKVNGIDFSREVLAIDSLNFPKELTFDKIDNEHLFVDILNAIPVDQESLQNISTNFVENLDNITTKVAQIKQIVNIETLNGMKWTDLMSKIVMLNNPLSIDELTVNGNVVLIDYTSGININSLNGLSFPSNYVLKTGPKETVIDGAKTFTGKLCKYFKISAILFLILNPLV